MTGFDLDGSKLMGPRRWRETSPKIQFAEPVVPDGAGRPAGVATFFFRGSGCKAFENPEAPRAVSNHLDEEEGLEELCICQHA